MAIPGSGALSLSAIQTEYGGSNPISLSEYYRGGSLVPTSSSTAGIASSGAITMSSFYGTANRVPITLTISSNTTNYNIYNNRGGTYVAGVSDVTLVNNATISSTSTGTAALDTGTGWTSGDTITIDNNSTVVGDGGNGGTGASINRATVSSSATAGGAAGHAVNIRFATTIDNAGGTLSGGGGGGGGGASNHDSAPFKSGTIEGNGGGGGGGGGQGGGAGGAAGSATGAPSISVNGSAGAAGSLSAAGAGGAGGNFSSGTLTGSASAGGSGGTVGAAGSSGLGSYGSGPGAGGAAGKAVNLNGNTVTFTATGTRNGATS